MNMELPRQLSMSRFVGMLPWGAESYLMIEEVVKACGATLQRYVIVDSEGAEIAQDFFKA